MIPGPARMASLVELTQGEVQPNDFYATEQAA